MGEGVLQNVVDLIAHVDGPGFANEEAKRLIVAGVAAAVDELGAKRFVGSVGHRAAEKRIL